jgi:DNA replication protein DnaC
MEASRIQGNYDDTINHFRKFPLMVIDDFLLLPTNQEEQHDLLILLRARDEDHTSTVLCSQISVEGWHERLGSVVLLTHYWIGSRQMAMRLQSTVMYP